MGLAARLQPGSWPMVRRQWPRVRESLPQLAQRCIAEPAWSRARPLRRTGSCTVATTFSNQVCVWRAMRSCLWERSAFASSWPKPAQLRQRQAVPSGHQRAPRAITGASCSLDHRRLDVELREPGSARLCLLKGTRTREGRNVYLTVISQASNRHPSGWRGARKLAGQRPSALSQRSSQSKAAIPCHLCSPSKMSIAILSSTPSS